MLFRSLSGPDEAGYWFGEDQGRYLIAVPAGEAAEILQKAAQAQVPAEKLGRSGGGTLTLNAGAPISLSELRRTHEAWLPDFMRNDLHE